MIFNKRLIFVTGKGGAGKTTLSAALGVAASKLGKRVLLVETDEGESLASIFSYPELTMTPANLHPGIQGARIAPRQVLEEYVKKYISLSFIANRIVRAELFEHLAEAAPGLSEIMTLGQIWRWEKRRNELDQLLYDMIIVDTPATGHGLSLLRQPRTLVNMLKFGPIAEQTRQVQELLQNADKTGILLATLAEELPVNEAVDFILTIENDMNMNICMTVVNALYKNIFSDEDSRRLSDITQNGHNISLLAENPIIQAAWTFVARRRMQQAHLERFIQFCGASQTSAGSFKWLEIPFFFTNALSVAEIEAIAALMLEVNLT